MRRLQLLVSVVALATTMAGCNATSEGDEPVDTVSQDEAAVRVQDRALAVAAHLKVPLENPRVLPDSCSDPAGNPSETGVFYMTGRGQLKVGKDHVSEAPRTLHRYFTEQGFDVEDTQWFDDGMGHVRATDPDGFSYSTFSMTSGAGYAFSVSSPCYQAPDGEDPNAPGWFPLPHPTWDAQPGAT